ncbi:hypothetical protein NX059_003087 [Plenodomus lindquistii]|nr:hypothetical protein NX059_003087 [Plenodomus lindquistii]
MSKLFEPLALGSAILGHRFAMAPLSWYRMNDDYTPSTMSKEYYSQRSCVPGTLLISEATIIAPCAIGANNAPGIWCPPQIAAWKEVTDIVHANGCIIYCQIWHQGRAAHPDVVEANGFKLLSSSAVPIWTCVPDPGGYDGR